MRYRIRLQRLRANVRGFHAGQARFRPIPAQRFSITAPPNATQSQILSELNKYASRAAEQAHGNTFKLSGVALLASRDFTSWLDDEDFMSTFLKTLLGPMNTGKTRAWSLHVLSGITDGLGPCNLSGECPSGFSVLCGPASKILPGLWANDGISGTTQDSAAHISLVTNPLVKIPGVLEVTVPLANTVFQNGRRSSLYASRWDIGTNGSMVLQLKCSKTNQRIAGGGYSVSPTSSIIPLLPLTQPRRIVSSFGNIVRQVEVDDSITSASKELETIIPEILEKRAQHESTSSPGPIGVWCWVIPPYCMGIKKFDNLNLFKAGSSQSETDVALSSMELFSDLLSSGCRLHKILSGGGGWGQKQGLLSLDPEASPSWASSDNDMELFIKSFNEGISGPSAYDVAPPGSYLMFCIEPHMTEMKAQSSQLLASMKTLALGVAPGPEYTPSSDHHSDLVEIIDNYFGISSVRGLFLKTTREYAGISSSDEVARKSVTTKVDVPGAYFCI
ncbi:putative v-type c subunit family protein [Rosellinia necatrix]|uniref:Putative v-type c subunit family protein n=1 Tax=Rosellinia necatrix TaxID=77044 RepID=A0A1W2TB09_ROSNE|nr:putative v-type c subunit family protein [Rosellinia necatrix]